MVNICNAIEAPAGDDEVLRIGEEGAGVSGMRVITTADEQGLKGKRGWGWTMLLES
jgi:hypothetical protein